MANNVTFEPWPFSVAKWEPNEGSASRTFYNAWGDWKDSSELVDPLVGPHTWTYTNGTNTNGINTTVNSDSSGNTNSFQWNGTSSPNINITPNTGGSVPGSGTSWPVAPGSGTPTFVTYPSPVGGNNLPGYVEILDKIEELADKVDTLLNGNPHARLAIARKKILTKLTELGITYAGAQLIGISDDDEEEWVSKGIVKSADGSRSTVTSEICSNEMDSLYSLLEVIQGPVSEESEFVEV